jgi:hypothetical protein
MALAKEALALHAAILQPPERSTFAASGASLHRSVHGQRRQQQRSLQPRFSGCSVGGMQDGTMVP